MRNLFQLGCLSALIFLIAANGQARTQEITTGYRLKTGDFHPDFSYSSIHDGQVIKLSGFRGKKLLLLHFASW